MKSIKTILFFLFISSNIFSQTDLNKVYVLCEGSGSGTSGLSLYRAHGNVFTQNIFSGGTLGLFPDGIVIYNNSIYLLEQGGFGGPGKIYKLDTAGNVLTSKTFGKNPYSLAIANNKIYVTNGPGSYVSVLDISSLDTIKRISVGVYPQEILAIGNKVFVCNTSLFGGAQDSTVSVIDAVLDSVVNTIRARKDPSSLAQSTDSKLLVGCPGNATNSIIYKIDPSTYVKLDSFEVSAGGFGSDISIDSMSADLYFISNTNNIVRLNTSTRISQVVISNPNPATTYFYGYAYEWRSMSHYAADAKSFAVNGSLNIYNSAGTLQNTFVTKIAPRRVVLNYHLHPLGISIISQEAAAFSLGQNFPNPFNPETKIKFSVPSSKGGFGSVYARLVVYDILGREVRTLVDERLSAGTYEISFNGSDLPSGVYYYQITAGDFRDTKKMLMIK